MSETAWKYVTEDVALIPYAPDRTAIFPETYLGSLYLELKKQDLLKLMFPGMVIEHMNDFISYFSNKAHPLLICHVFKDGVIGEQAGIGWIAQSEGQDGARRGSFGFGFFRKYWATKEARSLSFLMLAWWFFELNMDVLHAVTLRSNGLARNFSKNFGFTVIGRIPKFFYSADGLSDATLLCLERADFQPLYDKWRESIEPRTVTHELTPLPEQELVQ